MKVNKNVIIGVNRPGFNTMKEEREAFQYDKGKLVDGCRNGTCHVVGEVGRCFGNGGWYVARETGKLLSCERTADKVGDILGQSEMGVKLQINWYVRAMFEQGRKVVKDAGYCK